MKNLLTFISLTLAITFTACSDDDSFSSSPNNLLTFEKDTLCLDTVFSTIPSPHKLVMVHNNSGDGIRITNVRLKNGNQTGYRVNVQGTFLSKELGWQVNDLELRKNDSLRIFVELTSANNNDTIPKLVADDLVFTLESGVKQQLNLKAWSWDAFLLDNVTVSNDTIISNPHGKPVIVYGNIKVNEGATLTIAPGTTIYFHNNAGIDVDGRLNAKGEKDKEITLRCDRLDRMVSNLTYDNNPGQWGGITLRGQSYDNEITYTDLHGATNAIVCDSAFDVTRKKLSLSNTTIHNVKGNGLKAENALLTIENVQISNAKDTCLAIKGGNVEVNNTTIAQYYPFESYVGPALVFGNDIKGNHLPLTLTIMNSIIKGKSDDEIYRTYDSDESLMTVSFQNSLLRTPLSEGTEQIKFDNCIFEDVKDTMTSARNSFVLYDTDFFFYDFTPKEGSKAIGTANKTTAMPADRNGRPRDSENPDMGCFETEKKKNEEE